MYETLSPVTPDAISIPVYIGMAEVLNDDERRLAATAIAQLQTLLSHTALILVPAAAHTDSTVPVWFRIVRSETARTHEISACLEVALASLDSSSSPSALHDLLRSALTPSTAWRYTIGLFHGIATGASHGGSDSDAAIVCAQLAALEQFNRKLARRPADSGVFIDRCNAVIEPTPVLPVPARPVPEAPGLAHIHAVGAAADHFAILYQTRWQQLVLATTNQLASLHSRNPIGRLIGLCALALPVSLILSGILSALGYAMFTELSGGCREPDYFFGEMCMSPVWQHWVGPTAFFGFYLLSLAWAWCRYAAAKAERIEHQHQDYRLLAECLRVQYVLGVLGQPLCVHEFLPMVEHAEAGWVRLAILSLEYRRNQHPVPLAPAHDNARIERARQDFIVVQASYHADKLIVRRERAVAVLNGFAAFGMRLFLLILLVLVVHVTMEMTTGRHVLSEMAHHVLIVVQIVSLAFWGSMRKVVDMFGLEQEIQRGKLVLHALSHASAEAPGSQLRLLDALRVFAADQAAWHALQRAKPIEAATGA